MNTLFLADLHLNHTKALTFEAKRGTFRDVLEHDSYIVAQINKHVRPKDALWLLGDIFLGKSTDLPYFYYLMSQMNGVKNLIKGNHDQFGHEYYNVFKRVEAVHYKYGFVMTHVPIHPDSLTRWGKNVHGHLHSAQVRKPVWSPSASWTEVDRNYLCVSCEQHPSGEFARPWTINEVREALK